MANNISNLFSRFFSMKINWNEKNNFVWTNVKVASLSVLTKILKNGNKIMIRKPFFLIKRKLDFHVILQGPREPGGKDFLKNFNLFYLSHAQTLVTIFF